LHGTSVVFFEIQDFAGLAFDAGHGMLYVAALCLSDIVGGAGSVVLW
jgi:hypothetical protein